MPISLAFSWRVLVLISAIVSILWLPSPIAIRIALPLGTLVLMAGQTCSRGSFQIVRFNRKSQAFYG